MTAGLQVSVGPKRTDPIADWRLPPRETMPAGSAAADTLWLRLFAWAFLLIGVSAFIFFVQRESDEAQYFIGWFKSFAMIVLTQLIIIYLVNRMNNYVSRGVGLRRLKTKVPNEVACPASIHIRQDTTVTGMDEGYLWFEEGTLFYKGLQTVFRINAADLIDPEKLPRRDRPQMGSGKNLKRIHLHSGHRTLSLDYRLIDPFEDYHTRRRAYKFNTELARWVAERPEGSIETTLPPLDVHPELMRTDRLRYEGVVSGAVLVVLNFIILFSLRLSFDPQELQTLLNVFSVIIVGTLIYQSVKFAWQQHLDLMQRRAIFLESQLSSPLEV